MICKLTAFTSNTSKALTLALMLVLALAVQSCTTTGTILNPETPTVTLKQIKPISFTLGKQEIELVLNVDNPNSFPLPINTLIFAASLADEHIANGASNKQVNVPANGSAELNIVVETSLRKLFGKVRAALDDGNNLDYKIKGLLKLDNWPKSIPFRNAGKIANPML